MPVPTITFKITCVLGLACLTVSGCGKTGCVDEFRCTPATDGGSGTTAEPTTDSASDTDTTTTDAGPEQGMPSQGFWGYTLTYDDVSGKDVPISRQVCAATEAQLADPENPPNAEDMICVTSSSVDGSYALELEVGSYGLCYDCDFDCIFEITEGLVIKRDWQGGPGISVFEPACTDGV